ncbi:MAG: OmpH family outer membrane protein [Phycisphaerales bacterium]
MPTTLRRAARFNLRLALPLGLLIAVGGAAAAQTQPATPAAPPTAPSTTPAPTAVTPPPTAASTIPKLGFCDVVGIASRLVSTEPYAKELREKQNEINGRVKPMETELNSLIEQIRKADPQPGVKPLNPEAVARLRDQFNARQQEYSAVAKQAASEFSQLISRANIEAYKQVLAAIDAVSARRGYTVIFAVRPMDELKNADTPPAFIQSVLARPAVRFPAEDDITADVVKELKLPPEPPAGTAPPAAPAAPGATPPTTPANGGPPAPPAPSAPTTPASKKP